MKTSETEPHHHHTEEALTHLRIAVSNLESVQTMIVDQRPCAEVVKNLSGVLITLIECRSIIAQDHITSCIRDALQPGQEKVLNDVIALCQQLLKGPLQGTHH